MTTDTSKATPNQVSCNVDLYHGDTKAGKWYDITSSDGDFFGFIDGVGAKMLCYKGRCPHLAHHPGAKWSFRVKPGGGSMTDIKEIASRVYALPVYGMTDEKSANDILALAHHILAEKPQNPSKPWRPTPGVPARTRGGQKVTDLVRASPHERWPLLGYVDGICRSWRENGRYSRLSDKEHPLDLVDDWESAATRTVQMDDAPVEMTMDAKPDPRSLPRVQVDARQTCETQEVGVVGQIPGKLQP